MRPANKKLLFGLRLSTFISGGRLSCTSYTYLYTSSFVKRKKLYFVHTTITFSRRKRHASNVGERPPSGPTYSRRPRDV